MFNELRLEGELQRTRQEMLDKFWNKVNLGEDITDEDWTAYHSIHKVMTTTLYDIVSEE